MRRCHATECQAEVLFVPSATTGKPMILNVEPAKGVVLVAEAEGDEPCEELYSEDRPGRIGGEPRARVVDVYTDHHATCPAAAKFRKVKP